MLLPKLRFKEFSDGWNEYPLEEIICLKNNKYNPNSNISYKCIELEHIEQQTGNIIGYCNSIEQKSIKFMFSKNDILFGKLRPYLKKYWFAKFDGVCSTEIWVINSNNQNVINKFIYYIIQTSKFNSICCISTGTKMPRADWNYIKKYSYYIPSLEEQTKISNFLNLIDKKIELQQKLVYNLNLYKKGLLQKVFSNNQNWKIAKLGDFLIESKIIETNLNLSKRLTVRLNLLGIEARNPNYAVEKEDSSIQYRRKAGQFIYGKQNLHKGALGIIPNHLNNYQSSSDLPSFDFKNNINPIFFYYFMSREDYYKSLENISTGTGSKRINPSSFLNLNIKIPNIEEQNQIADLFTNLDKKIDFETSKLNNLKEYKKGLLQKMFI